MGLQTRDLNNILNKLISREILIEKLEILDKINQIEKDIPLRIMLYDTKDDTSHQWEARWISLICWLETYENSKKENL